MSLPRSHLLVAATQLFVAAVLGAGIWLALPARWWPVDVGGSALALACVGGAIGLVVGRPWGILLARVASWALLVSGCVTVTALAFSVAHLFGLYGPVGAGGSLLLGTIAALIVPYLVGLPALQLRWLTRGR